MGGACAADGFATFNLTTHGITGQTSAYGVTYGHLGATYGYDSIVAYFPAIDLSLSIASNIETDTQVQPADTACFAYNAVLSHVLDVPQPTCSYEAGSYHHGTCSCSWPTPPPAPVSHL